MKIPIWKSITIGWNVISVINEIIKGKKPTSEGGVKLSDNERKRINNKLEILVMNVISGLKGK
ncbi:MAG: hypothetical protein ABII90_10240 [Bacteroidota bacterium]